ncbi:MAG TPA: NADP-dependent oxidoreductase, partial [Brevibacterium sp.]|nr:NADP-dependent oxidoreductase [Brevibacterium sp.]
VRAAGVNPADSKIRAGQMGDHWRLPAPMGREAAGTVTAVGVDVEGIAIGDEVVGLAAKGHGTFADHALLNAEQTVLKPQELTFAEAAALPVAGATAYDATHQIDVEPAGTVVILGAGGGVGLLAAQIGAARRWTVIGVASAAKQEVVESTGAAFVESGQGAATRVRAVAPEGADLLIDLVGGQVLREIAEVVKDPRTIVTTADPDTAEQLGGAGVRRTPDGLEKIIGAAQNGVVAPHISRRFPLADAQDAIAAVEGGHTTGKVVLEP